MTHPVQVLATKLQSSARALYAFAVVVVVVVVVVFKTGFLCVALRVLELVLYIRQASNSQRSACLCLSECWD